MELNKRFILENNTSGIDWVIPDVHGCLYTLKDLIQRLAPSKKDRLIFLGDLVNKGPFSAEVLDYLIEYSSSNQIYICIGNHDFIWLEQNRNIINYSFYKAFYNKACYYIETENEYLVHAGFDFSLSNPFDELEPMYTIRKFEVDSLKSKGKKVIHGHFPKTLEEIEDSLSKDLMKIALDNGCVYPQKKGMGNLLALNLQNKELVKVKNSDIRFN